jgi:signal peptidase I|tara:strand:- start:541 stop:762 length:222 start_codon:yes stop_codon:yes gene_type:complete
MNRALAENKLIGPVKDHLDKLGLKQEGDVVYYRDGKYYGYVEKVDNEPMLYKVMGMDNKEFLSTAVSGWQLGY